MDIKATPTGVKTYETYSTFIEYEYRGYKYDVEYSNGAMTYNVGDPKTQHEDAQEKIDKIIEDRTKKKEYRYEDTAQAGLDLFFEIIGE